MAETIASNSFKSDKVSSGIEKKKLLGKKRNFGHV
jgi:hypothetical protein